VIAQRLIRKVCPRCRVSEDIELEALVTSHASTNGALAHSIRKVFGQKQQLRMYKGKGCPVCHHTGYLGRIGVYELLEVTQTVREGISNNLDAAKIQELAVTDGMLTMLEDGLLKVSQGLTTIEEVLRVTKE
jgi:type II secretory ATPase GspE/PulE/Tfp pilus assembly ATPase PilB-like protein